MGFSRFNKETELNYMRSNSAKADAGYTSMLTYNEDIQKGVRPKAVNERLNPYGVAMRESRDSAGEKKVPIAIFLDTTGSMAAVPEMIQKELPNLMTAFTGDKKSGKKYLGENTYPDIMMGAVDDCAAMGARGNNASGALQVGQFESGIEIDEDITSVWLTGRGGGTYEESYEMALYFMARHTSHDHWDLRGRKGYIFIIGDEYPYKQISKVYVDSVIGDKLDQNISIEEMLDEVRKRYNVFFVLPNMTNHWGDPELRKYWSDLIGAENCILLKDPDKICEAIVSVVAATEAGIDSGDIKSDLDFDLEGSRLIEV